MKHNLSMREEKTILPIKKQGGQEWPTKGGWVVGGRKLTKNVFEENLQNRLSFSLELLEVLNNLGPLVLQGVGHLPVRIKGLVDVHGKVHHAGVGEQVKLSPQQVRLIVILFHLKYKVWNKPLKNLPFKQTVRQYSTKTIFADIKRISPRGTRGEGRRDADLNKAQSWPSSPNPPYFCCYTPRSEDGLFKMAIFNLFFFHLDFH